MEINLKDKKKRTNFNKLSNRRNDDIKFVDDYGSMILEANWKATEEEPKPEQTWKTENEIKNDEKSLNEKKFKEYCFIILHYF